MIVIVHINLISLFTVVGVFRTKKCLGVITKKKTMITTTDNNLPFLIYLSQIYGTGALNSDP
jgi:hypothetical protein